MKSLPDRENGVQTSEPTFGSRASEILETIGDGFCAIDREWRIVYVNSARGEMWGSTPEAMIGRVFWDGLPANDRHGWPRSFSGRDRGRQQGEYETFSPIIVGWLWVRVCPMSGGLTGSIGEIFQTEKARKRRSATARKGSGEYSSRTRSEWRLLILMGACVR